MECADAPRRVNTVLGTNDPVKAIILDDNFWVQLVDALKVMTPIVKLLRLTDGNAPALGKILPRMEGIREAITKLDIPWQSEALQSHDDRWAYLQSPMHFAATCLDPEFLTRDMDEAMQDGLIAVTERLCLRDEMKSLHDRGRPGDIAQAQELTISSPAVQVRVEVAMGQLSRYQEKEGIFAKHFVQNGAKTMPPSTWWSTYGNGIPVIASMARTVLGQPGCASAAGT